MQETWISVLRGIDRFEGRSSLKTWVFRILSNTAKTRAQREDARDPVLGTLGPRTCARGRGRSPAGFSTPSTRGGPATGRWPRRAGRACPRSGSIARGDA